jgi:hemoglobin
MRKGMLKDIENRGDIETLVDEFYKKVIADDLIGHFFTKVIELKWDRHIPTMYDFWETTLLGKMRYKGNPMVKHIELNRKESLNPEHFDRWLALWESTVTENFGGGKAEEAIHRARQIGELMKYKIQHLSGNL